MARNSRTRGPRRDKSPATRILLLGIGISILLGGVIFLLLRIANGAPGIDYQKFYVSTPTVGNLLLHDPVRIDGVRVGQVLKIDVGDDGQPLVELQLDPATKLTKGTAVSVRANGLLGARFVGLEPGEGEELLAEGSTIEGTDNSYTYGLPEFVSVFDQPTRVGLRHTLDSLGDGLLGQGKGLNVTLRDLAIGPREAGEVAQAILARDGAAARFFPSIASATGPFARNRAQIRPGADALTAAINPFITQREAVRASLDRLPATLAAAEDGLGRGVNLMRALRSFSTNAASTLQAAPAGLNNLAHLLEDSKSPLRLTLPLAKHLGSAVPVVEDLVGELGPFVPRAKEGIDLLRPTLASVNKYGCDIRNMGVVMRSMTGFTQPGTGPAGPAMAFRLQAVPPNGLDAIGGGSSITRRDAYSPCKYLSGPYDQFTPKPVVPAFQGGNG